MPARLGKKGPGRWSLRGLARNSSPEGREQRKAYRASVAPSGEAFTKPGSGNPRKTGR